MNESPAVDKSLVAMFLRMTVEERVQANDNAVRAILELRDAYKKKKKSITIEERISALRDVLTKKD